MIRRAAWLSWSTSLSCALAVALGVAAAACDSPPAGSPPAADAGSDSALGDRCAAEPSVDRCAQCCGYTTTVLDPYIRGYESCVCDTACKAECADSLCAQPSVEPNAACEACLGKLETILACEETGNAQCDGVATCQTFRDCGNAAGCLQKPDDTPDAGPGGG